MKSPPGTLAGRVETAVRRAAQAVPPLALWNCRAAVTVEDTDYSCTFRLHPIDNMRIVPMGSLPGRHIPRLGTNAGPS
jgi:hypothetical protein